MRKMIFATGNEGKVREVQAIMADMEVEVLSLKAAGISVEIEENGTSFEENALLKAREIAKRADAVVLADDSGLEIDYLNKEPGIYSARYLGEDTPYTEKNRIILERMEKAEEEERTARFICAMAAVLEDGTVITTHGEMEGRIGYESKGENGFGYDPIFYLPEYGMTSAQISPEEKNRISHRGKALKKMKEELLKKWK